MKRRFPSTKVAGLVCLFLALGVGLYLVLHQERNAPSPAEARLSEVQKQAGLFYRVGVTNPFSGVILDFYSNGTRRSRTEVRNGQLHGISEGWFTNGILQVRESFQAGVASGTRTVWREDGSKLSEGRIAQGQFEGPFAKWHPNGRPAEWVKMDRGIPDGWSRAWYPSGFLKARVRLDQGKVVEQEFFDESQCIDEPPPAS